MPANMPSPPNLPDSLDIQEYERRIREMETRNYEMRQRNPYGSVMEEATKLQQEPPKPEPNMTTLTIVKKFVNETPDKMNKDEMANKFMSVVEKDGNQYLITRKGEVIATKLDKVVVNYVTIMNWETTKREFLKYDVIYTKVSPKIISRYSSSRNISYEDMQISAGFATGRSSVNPAFMTYDLRPTTVPEAQEAPDDDGIF